MKQLLVECHPFIVDRQQIVECMSTPGAPLIVSGVLQRADAKNQNGRVYPYHILERECKKYMQNEVRQRRALGELDHPDSQVVNLRNVSHNIIDMWWDGKNLMGKIEILSTPAGNILKSLFDAGVTLGISSRGMGSVKPLSEDNTMEVQEDFELVTFDFVSNPSTHGAYLYPVNESAEPTKVKSAQVEVYNECHKIITEVISDLSTKVNI